MTRVPMPTEYERFCRLLGSRTFQSLINYEEFCTLRSANSLDGHSLRSTGSPLREIAKLLASLRLTRHLESDTEWSDSIYGPEQDSKTLK